MTMEEEKWTVVGRRRAAPTRRRPPRCRSGGAEAPPLQLQECDGALLLFRLTRSMGCLQESLFFHRLLLQVQSSPVLSLLSRAACSHHSNVECEHAQPKSVALPDESAERPACENAHGNQDVSLPIKGSSANSAVVSNSLCAPRIDACGHIVESAASNALSQTLNCGKSSTMECNSVFDSCRKSGAIDAKCTCRESTEQWRLDVVLYGLGSINGSEISRCQLALILLLKQRVPWVGNIEVYDPVLTPSECNVIKRMGCLPVATDEKGRRPITGPTLFYMPHCEDWLYDNVLQANWVPGILQQIVILGNSFREYQECWSCPLIRRKKPPPSYVVQYQQIAKEVPLEATSSTDVPGFNNLSWHFYELCSTL